MYMCVHRIHNRKKWKFHAPYARAPYLNTPIYMRKRVKPSTSAPSSGFSLIELESRFLFQDYSSNPISISEVREERARKRERERERERERTNSERLQPAGAFLRGNIGASNLVCRRPSSLSAVKSYPQIQRSYLIQQLSQPQISIGTNVSVVRLPSRLIDQSDPNGDMHLSNSFSEHRKKA